MIWCCWWRSWAVSCAVHNDYVSDAKIVSEKVERTHQSTLSKVPPSLYNRNKRPFKAFIVRASLESKNRTDEKGWNWTYVTYGRATRVPQWQRKLTSISSKSPMLLSTNVKTMSNEWLADKVLLDDQKSKSLASDTSTGIDRKAQSVMKPWEGR